MRFEWPGSGHLRLTPATSMEAAIESAAVESARGSMADTLSGGGYVSSEASGEASGEASPSGGQGERTAEAQSAQANAAAALDSAAKL